MSTFDGLTGMVAAKVMARMNAAAEREAVDVLDPEAGDAILVIGFGPGVGLQHLLRKHASVTVFGVDPSSVMMSEATQRNQADVQVGRLKLYQCGVLGLSAEAGPFDGAIAVNSIQMCEPFAQTALHLRHLLRPGGRLVTITHDWAMSKQAGSVSSFVAVLGEALGKAGFEHVQSRKADAEKGRAVIIEAY